MKNNWFSIAPVCGNLSSRPSISLWICDMGCRAIRSLLFFPWTGARCTVQRGYLVPTRGGACSRAEASFRAHPAGAAAPAEGFAVLLSFPGPLSPALGPLPLPRRLCALSLPPPGSPWVWAAALLSRGAGSPRGREGPGPLVILRVPPWPAPSGPALGCCTGSGPGRRPCV